MSLDPAIFRALVANGATPEMLLAVVEAAAAVEEEGRARKRAGNAERQQRFRDRNASNALHDVTERDSVTSPAPSPSSSPDPSNNPTPTHGETPRARKGTRIPEDWRPATLNPETVAGEVVGRRGQEWARRALESFKNHWRSANGPTATKRDWQAAWANWIIEQDNRDGRRNGNERMAGNGRGGSPSGMGPTIDAADRFLARRELSGTA